MANVTDAITQLSKNTTNWTSETIQNKLQRTIFFKLVVKFRMHNGSLKSSELGSNTPAMDSNARPQRKQ